jgi:hypothetical protein
MGANCPFRHDDPEGSQQAAQFCAKFQRGACARGSTCKYSHELPQPAAAPAEEEATTVAAAKKIILKAAQRDYNNPDLTNEQRRNLKKKLQAITHTDRLQFVGHSYFAELFTETAQWLNGLDVRSLD